MSTSPRLVPRRKTYALTARITIERIRELEALAASAGVTRHHVAVVALQVGLEVLQREAAEASSKPAQA